jgi:lipopolysaccharide/colanic/teichoic acid biosynthesis glycosyltransferase
MKRIFDLVFSIVIPLSLFPLLIIVTFLVWFKFGSPVFFRQLRPGLNGKLFHIYKFRTMTFERDKNGTLLSDKDRLTNFGKFLRSTSIDELPGLWSVFKGDMSLVWTRLLHQLAKQRTTSGTCPLVGGAVEFGPRGSLTRVFEYLFHLHRQGPHTVPNR